jgi:hypothetical protein
MFLNIKGFIMINAKQEFIERKGWYGHDTITTLEIRFTSKYTEGYTLKNKMKRRLTKGLPMLKEDHDRAWELIDSEEKRLKKRCGAHDYGHDYRQDDSQWIAV